MSLFLLFSGKSKPGDSSSAVAVVRPIGTDGVRLSDGLPVSGAPTVLTAESSAVTDASHAVAAAAAITSFEFAGRLRADRGTATAGIRAAGPSLHGAIDTSIARLGGWTNGSSSHTIKDASPAAAAQTTGGGDFQVEGEFFFDVAPARAKSLCAAFETVSLVDRSAAAAATRPSSFDTIESDIAPFSVTDTFSVLSAFLGHYLKLLKDDMIEPPKLLAILDTIHNAISGLLTPLQNSANILVDPNTGIPILTVGGDGIVSSVYGTGDETFIEKIGPANDALTLASGTSPVDDYISYKYRAWYAALSSYFAFVNQPGITNLNQYASYYNAPATGTIYSFLVAQNAAYAYLVYNNKSGSLMMTPSNVAAPVTEFATAVVGPTAGAISLTQVGQIRTVNDTVNLLQGFTPSKGVSAAVTTTINGTLTVTVTASGWDASGNVVTGRTWTATLSSATSGSKVAFTPNVTGDRISQVTACTATGTATAGGFTLNSVNERSNLD